MSKHLETGQGRGGAGRASLACLNPEPKGLWPRSPGCCPRQGAGTWRGCRKVTPVAPVGWGSAGQSLEPLLGRALDEVPSRVSWCQAEKWDTGLVPGLRGAKERAEGWAGASWVLEGHPARQ